MNSFPMGRVSRRPARMDLVATLQLMPLAHAVQALALGESAAKIAYRCGLNAGDAEALREHLVQPSWAWIKLRLPSVGRKLKADDLISLERIFDRVFSAMSRSPTVTRYAAIRTFSQALTGPLPPSRGFSADELSGAQALFAAARLGTGNLVAMPHATNSRLISLSLESASELVRRHWLEAVALGLMKAQLQQLIKRYRALESQSCGPATA